MLESVEAQILGDFMLKRNLLKVILALVPSKASPVDASVNVPNPVTPAGTEGDTTVARKAVQAGEQAFRADENENGFFQSVHGESFHQSALRALFEIGPVHRVYLQPETDNPYDAHAVAVKTMDGVTVGHLPREDASLVWSRLRNQEMASGQKTSCLGQLTGGTKDKPSVGIVLNFARDRSEMHHRAHDEKAWESYVGQPPAMTYSWTYDGVTVQYNNASWEFHEPDTYRPKPIRERFYNELSPEHVNQLLSKWAEAKQKGRIRKQSDEARALANQLTRQCIATYPRCSESIFEWRAKILLEAGVTCEATQLLRDRLEVCKDDRERRRLLKILERADRGAAPKTTKARRRSDVSLSGVS